jgi:hypothetical protein
MLVVVLAAPVAGATNGPGRPLCAARAGTAGKRAKATQVDASRRAVTAA